MNTKTAIKRDSRDFLLSEVIKKAAQATERLEEIAILINDYESIMRELEI